VSKLVGLKPQTKPRNYADLLYNNRTMPSRYAVRAVANSQAAEKA